MMVVELENEPVADLIFLETVNIKPQNPDIYNENSYSAPSWEISCKWAWWYNTEILINDNEDKCS